MDRRSFLGVLSLPLFGIKATDRPILCKGCGNQLNLVSIYAYQAVGVTCRDGVKKIIHALTEADLREEWVGPFPTYPLDVRLRTEWVKKAIENYYVPPILDWPYVAGFLHPSSVTSDQVLCPTKNEWMPDRMDRMIRGFSPVEERVYNAKNGRDLYRVYYLPGVEAKDPFIG